MVKGSRRTPSARRVSKTAIVIVVPARPGPPYSIHAMSGPTSSATMRSFGRPADPQSTPVDVTRARVEVPMGSTLRPSVNQSLPSKVVKAAPPSAATTDSTSR